MPIFEGNINNEDFVAQQKALNDKIARMEALSIEEIKELERSFED